MDQHTALHLTEDTTAPTIDRLTAWQTIAAHKAADYRATAEAVLRNSHPTLGPDQHERADHRAAQDAAGAWEACYDTATLAIAALTNPQ